MDKVKCILNEKLLVDGAKKVVNLALSNSSNFSKKVVENAPGGLALGIFAGSLFTVISSINEFKNNDTDTIL